MLKTMTRAGAAALLMTSAALAQDEEVEITAYDLGAGIYALYGQGGNVGLSVGEDGVLMIDDQYAPVAEPIMAAIGEITDQPVNFVLNTHWHGDHVGGNEAFAGAGAFIVAHENVRLRMAEGMDDPRRGNPVPPAAPEALPDLTVTDGVTFHMNGETVRVVHVPRAHTDGDTIVVFEEVNILHMGDTFFNGMYPFIDVFSGGSIDGMIEGLALGLSLADEVTQIIPGHGPLADKAAMQDAHDLLVQARGLVQAAIDEGLSLDETVERDPLADLTETYGGGFISGENMTTLTYLSLTGLPDAE